MFDDMRSRLEAYYARAYPARQHIRVTRLDNTTTGWETEIYSFDIEYEQAGGLRSDALIMRVYPGADARVRAAHEFRNLQELHAMGYPVPRVVLLERESSGFNQPFILMERIEGEVMWTPLGNASPNEQQHLLRQLCILLVRLHRLDWRPFGTHASHNVLQNPYSFTDQALSLALDYHQHFPEVGMLPIIKWLEARRHMVPCAHLSPVHWDFHPGNILLRPDGVAVVIDWSSLTVSDSRFDLAWSLLLVLSHSGVEMRDRLLQEYERVAGAVVEQLEFFEVFACARRLFSTAVSLSGGAERLGLRPSAARMMKYNRVKFERVYNLLRQRTGIRIAETERMLSSLPQ
ncbi:MAG TPA: phosphotransferase family protein [Pyrinomonadaceae bacterium]|jgi:aminoglycoside phosphotransferase (APT) family kinase protein